MSSEATFTRPQFGRGFRAGGGLYSHVLDTLGQDIVNGKIRVGELVYADQLCQSLGVSRSVVRECLRTLGSMGLVEARPQVGTRVQPRSNWDLMNPKVVYWRGRGPDYITQMSELLELRMGIESTAAHLAAQRIDPDAAQALLASALEMRELMHAGDSHGYFEADARFHRILLDGSGNEVIAQFGDTIAAVLEARSMDMRPGMHDLVAESVDLHIELAQAVVDKQPAVASAKAHEIVESTLEEFQAMGSPGLA